MRDFFHQFSSKISQLMGSPWAFLLALTVIVVWAFTGPLFGFSDTWQLVINTGTTIITFLMVFLIQNTQNRDSKAINLKLDELIYATHGARNVLVDLEESSEEQLDELHKHSQELHKRYAQRVEAIEGLRKKRKVPKAEKKLAEGDRARSVE